MFQNMQLHVIRKRNKSNLLGTIPLPLWRNIEVAIIAEVIKNKISLGIQELRLPNSFIFPAGSHTIRTTKILKVTERK